MLISVVYFSKCKKKYFYIFFEKREMKLMSAGLMGPKNHFQWCDQQQEINQKKTEICSKKISATK